MKEKLARLYPYLALILLLFWVIWWVFPLPQELDPKGVFRMLGFIALDALFLLFGALGLVLWRMGLLWYDLAALLVFSPILHLLGFMSGDRWWGVLCYLLPIILIPIYAVLFSRRLRN